MAGSRTSIYRRYAEAAFEIAERDGTVDQWLAQLGTVAAAVTDSTVVHRLEDPQIALETRAAALHKVLGADMLPQLGNLIRLVLRRRRVDNLPSIEREFRRLYNRRGGIVEAVATTALALDSAELAALKSRIETMTGKTVELETTVDPSILGGIQVRIGDRLYDGSVRGRLERLRAKLAAGAVSA